MIQIESIHIAELRGIRDLTLHMNRQSFAVSGPNGSGKSGVVDAIQFALTGEIGRLKGAGTGELSITDHGPHVERRSDPEAAFVQLAVFIPHLNKSASITRTIKKPNQPTIAPQDPAVLAVFEEIAQHPEISLSRREIIKFILSAATQRSQDVQALLKLDDIDQTRAVLKSTENKLNSEYTTASAQSSSMEESLKRHLDLPALTTAEILAAANKRRTLLKLPVILELTKDTDLCEGFAAVGSQEQGKQTKESALADIGVVLNTVAAGSESAATAIATLVDNINRVEADASLLPLIKRHSFLQAGLDLVSDPSCPLCDAEWDIDALRGHLAEKLARSRAAREVRDNLIAAGRVLSAEVIRLRDLLTPITKLPETGKDAAAVLGQWSGDLQGFWNQLQSVEGMISAKDRLATGWAGASQVVVDAVGEVKEKVYARPDRSAESEATGFLVVAQERLNNLRMACRNTQDKRASALLGRSAYKAYCDVSEAALVALYEEVEEEFGAYYRAINQDDEGEFKAKFEPAEGKLRLLVDFHKKGMFPPGAYHSEGHQDGMGVCLYLALMRWVLGKHFTIAVLDDVVMSVDSQHRKQFCKLLKTNFPDTQFIITTHDQVWAKQLRTEGLVSAKASVAFDKWTVETGPILSEVADVWEQIGKDLAKNEVPSAAARLRRHLEYVAAELADSLGAKVKFRADGGYDMGELLSAVIGRQGELLKLAAKVAKSWDDSEQMARVSELQSARNTILTAKKDEEWVINKAIHYNEWADLSKNDFQPVVTAFKELLQQFRCDKPKCGVWLYLTPRFDPADLRCSCGAFRLNLQEKTTTTAPAFKYAQNVPA